MVKLQLRAQSLDLIVGRALVEAGHGAILDMAVVDALFSLQTVKIYERR